MIYLYLNTNQIKALALKKNLFGQHEVVYFEKTFQVSLIIDGQVNNIDILASAVKEIVSNISSKIKDKDITLILPQESFKFFKTEIPNDIASSAINDFIFDKANSVLSINLREYSFDFFSIENGLEKKINVYAIKQTVLSRFLETFSLLGLKVINILPETIAYFKLFEKTLRKEKKESILFGHLEKNGFFAYFYDSYGSTETEKLSIKSTAIKEIEAYIKKATGQFAKEGKKINRLILSGPESEKVRQDTFTKNTGAWTNPLKKIITNFYDNYLKLLTPDKKPFPVLIFDVCFGAFIFVMENKGFSLLKKNPKLKKNNNINSESFKTKRPLLKGEYLMFIISFIASFVFFVFVSKLNINIKLPEFKIGSTPTPTVSPTPPLPTITPTPSYKKETLKIKVLNGGGIAGKATEVKNILKKAGYLEVLTGNADNFEYKNTVIQIKKTVDDAFGPIKTVFKDYSNTIKKETLTASATADLIIIIGQDFK